MYARRQGGRELTFDFAEGLKNDNLLVVDRETGSVWSQLAGQAIAGQMEGTPLEAMPAMQTTWAFWRRKHPDTRVMIFPNTKGHPYVYQDFEPGTPRRRSSTHDTSTLGLGLVVGGEAWFYPLRELAKVQSPMQTVIGNRQVQVFFDADGLTAWAEDDSGKQLMSVLAYEKGWRSFYPQTHVFEH